MRLFFQLEDQEQNDVLQHCVDIVIEDMLEGGMHLDPINKEEMELKQHLEEALEQTLLIENKEEKIEFLMSDPTTSKAIYDVALEMAKSAFYHDDEEMVIFPASLNRDEEEPVEKALPKKVPSSLN